MNYDPFIGGALIGLSAALFFTLQGRIAGISGIIGGGLRGEGLAWRLPFIIGLLISGALSAYTPELLGLSEPFENTVPRNIPTLAIAGLLVGLGTRLGNGCTSGHGVCGIARQSSRSIIATCVFMGAGITSAAVSQHLINSWVTP